MDDTTSRWPNVSLLVDSIVRDVYFVCRLLWKNVTVTAVAVVSVARDWRMHLRVRADRCIDPPTAAGARPGATDQCRLPFAR